MRPRFRPSQPWPMLALAVAIAGCAVQAMPEEAGDARAIRIDSRAVPFDNEDPHAETTGDLRFRGGLVLTSPDRQFGGYSGLYVAPDGTRMVAVSDRGHWIEAALDYDPDGRLAGVGPARLGPLRDGRGRSVAGSRLHDAEALARLPGGFAVAFEGVHRIWFYPDGGADGSEPFAGRARALPRPPGLVAAPVNRGIEALAALPDGRLVALTEGLSAGANTLQGWIVGGGGPWQRFSWERTGAFVPADATALPDGDLLVLERRFSLLGGFGARLVRVAAPLLRAGVTLSGLEVGLIVPPQTVDNFEGVAARRGARGETLVYLVSDDNFFPLQRTLLLMLELRPAP